MSSMSEFRRQKELEEARKAGIAPAAVDEEGKEINPHIPQYMSSAPWYLNNNRPSLKHQKDWRTHGKDAIGKFYDRGAKVFQAKAFRKGSCENCGAMSHKTRDCMERPRQKGAKWTNKHIAPDEKVEDIKLETYEARRDRWNGYEASDYSRIMDRYEKVEEAKKEMRKKAELEKRFETDGAAAAGSDDSDLEDEDKIAEQEEAGFGKVEKRVRTTGGGATGSARNLRIREDTAKYLLNLDPNSAHYDPKSRSMREDPQPYKDPSQKAFAGDNFVRQSGDFHDMEALAVHSFSAHDKGQDIHMQGAPSQAEALYKQFRAKKEVLQGKTKEQVMSKYGSAAKEPDEEVLALAQSEAYTEYNAEGRVIRGEASVKRSRYPEDVLVNNHTSVWGSWWSKGSWGYACCQQTTKNSYCTGAAGLESAAQAQELMDANLAHRLNTSDPPAEERNGSKVAAGASTAAWGSELPEGVELDEAKLREAMKKQKAFDHRATETDDRKRKFNSLAGNEEVTAEEMEAYRMSRNRADDPMAKYLAAGGED
ncbi:g1583 [Coccomyxa viridis]|uniref:Pre-mRNA-splicing factor SLU7 n=1 Tax=Coccomyxa viridis TaxID=1274662 RepID=A0ABP1FIB0_9CHLO